MADEGRMTDPCLCSSPCRWWAKLDQATDEGIALGECRRNAPRWHHEHGRAWPVTQENDWCRGWTEYKGAARKDVE